MARTLVGFLCFTVALGWAVVAKAVTIDWVTVGDPGNPADDTSYGSVDYTYLISKYEITNAQYAEFLSAVATTDTYDLYNTYMGSGYLGGPPGGIQRGGSSGSYTYSAIAGNEDMPVNYVSWYDTLRFANWLHNGQPTGAQDGTTTEDGAYTFSDATSVGARNLDATIFLTSEDEWYKAAYYDALSMSYFEYPAGSDAPTTCTAPGTTPNTANCGWYFADRTDVGSYTGSASPYGTFDQGGNVQEWNEASIGSDRVLRGGGYPALPAIGLAASARTGYSPSLEYPFQGFRVAMIPEPGTALLVGFGLVGLAVRRRLGA